MTRWPAVDPGQLRQAEGGAHLPLRVLGGKHRRSWSVAAPPEKNARGADRCDLEPALIDQLRTADITLTYEPDTRTLRTGDSSIAAVAVS